MDSIPLRSNQFMVSFPCFAIQSGRGISVQPLHEAGINGIAVLLFTDEDLAETFRQDFGLIGKKVCLNNADELLGFLQEVPHEVSHLQFDPSPKGYQRLIHIDDFLLGLAAKVL